MRLAEQIKEYVKCPQLGNAHYGKWGALILEQIKLKIKEIKGGSDDSRQTSEN